MAARSSKHARRVHASFLAPVYGDCSRICECTQKHTQTQPRAIACKAQKNEEVARVYSVPTRSKGGKKERTVFINQSSR